MRSAGPSTRSRTRRACPACPSPASPATSRPGPSGSRADLVRAALGDRRALISLASRRFDAMLFTYPFWLEAPPLHCAVLSSPSDFNFKYFLPERSLRRRSTRRRCGAGSRAPTGSSCTARPWPRRCAASTPSTPARPSPVPLGVTTGRPAPTADALEALRRERGLPGRFALVTGWITPHKNPLVVVEALAELRRGGVDLPVVFVGPNATELADGAPPGFDTPYVEPCDTRCTMAASSSAATSFRSGTSERRAGGALPPRHGLPFPTRYEGSGCPAWRRPWPGARPSSRRSRRSSSGPRAGRRLPGVRSRRRRRPWPTTWPGSRARGRGPGHGPRAAARVAEPTTGSSTARAYLAHAEQVLAGRAGGGHGTMSPRATPGGAS